MRLKKISTSIWITSISIFLFILYLESGIGFSIQWLSLTTQPSVKFTMQDVRLGNVLPLKPSKWRAIEPQLHPIESELNKQYAKFKDIEYAVTQKKYLYRRKCKHLLSKEQELQKIAFNISSCPLQKQSVLKTDIQMLSMYSNITFDDNSTQHWNIEYKENQWNETNKLKVFIVPHSHNDPGWISTFDKYYSSQTTYILNNMANLLPDYKGMKMIWPEISFLARWWEQNQNMDAKFILQSLLEEKRIEIVTGGWVMNDEANTHWISTVQQLTTGHQWCIDNLGIIPKNSWSIDAFGYSSSQPYLLNLAGFENSIIQRVHYRVKKELASYKQLEFRWRQVWDGVGSTDMFTHVLPFSSYDAVHSCGPDPKVCCQFDFAAQPGLCVPVTIHEKNIEERASLILDQWRKKAQLYRSNVVLFPLGDDHRYESSKEWDEQYQNYVILMEYINNNDTLNTEVKFGNLEDYFEAVHAEVNMTDFPVLSGDFFTYADAPSQYWSGYFTSRPLLKSIDRVLLAYLRAAETISSQVILTFCLSNVMSFQLRQRVETARRSLALFQHHEAISGTSRPIVVKDYAKKMESAIKACQTVIQQSAYYLLAKPGAAQNMVDAQNLYFDEVWRHHNEIPYKTTITFENGSKSRNIVLYNALPFTRHELFTVYVSSPHVEVFCPSGKPVMVQISPVVMGTRRLTFADYKYQLTFPVIVRSLGIATYKVVLSNNTNTSNNYTSYARIQVYNQKDEEDLPKIFPVVHQSDQLKEDLMILIENGTKVIFSMNGTIKTVSSPDGTATALNMSFVKYDSQSGEGKNSGAYLFMPPGPADQFYPEPLPQIIVTEGIYSATLYAALSSYNVAEIRTAVTIYNNPSLEQVEVEIVNILLIERPVDNLELAMRFSTDIQNGDVFYTDVNGMQMIKRRYFDKLPLQANYYPLPAAAYLEDERYRLTILTSTPLGVAALQAGQIEVMQDRRTLKDDGKGLDKGIRDNVRTRHTFKLIIEKANTSCTVKAPPEQPGGQLTLGAHVSQQLLLQPLIAMHYTDQHEPLSSWYSHATINKADLVLASYRTNVISKKYDGDIIHGVGMTFHRVHLEQCYGNTAISKWYQITNGQIHIREIVDAPSNSVHESTLTFVKIKNHLPNGVINLCPHEAKSIFLNDTFDACSRQ